MHTVHARWLVLFLPGCLLMAGCEQRQPAATQPAPVALATWDFDKAEPGQLPAGFVPGQNNPTKELAVWKVAADAEASSPPNVLTVETYNDNATFNLLLIEGTAYKDLDLSVKVRARTGVHDRGGGIIWRAKDENNYYICRMNPLETNFRVYKFVDGKRKQLASVEGIQTESDKWYTVRAVMSGDHIECYLDGQKLLDVHDEEFKDAGKVGLWTKADASSAFDDLIVREPR
ncbi:MAG TPA: DUF1080 domain-containing protein [Phycisphaerae bacterium]|nr:DUF1080 domain-containing protein [Phycisphaerae bacterium]HQE26845.1 DUF1080 domain-containing protein [Phycisphaerae bacterium]